MDVEFINNFWFGYSGFFLGISSLLYNEQLHINLKFIYYFIVKVYNRVKEIGKQRLALHILIGFYSLHYLETVS